MGFLVHFDLSCFTDTVVHGVNVIKGVSVDSGIGDIATSMACWSLVRQARQLEPPKAPSLSPQTCRMFFHEPISTA